MTYRQSAKFYDLFGSKNDVEFYKDLALQMGQSALELGVGTGRVAIALAQAGIKVAGLDNSIHMLKVAGEKLEKELPAVRKNVTLKRGDMRKFELGQSFPLIIIPASTFDHNNTIEKQQQTLSCVHKHLQENGSFAFDLEAVTPETPPASWWIDRKQTKNDELVVRSIFTRRNMATRTCSLDLFFDVYNNGKLLERFHEYGEVAIISKDQITRLLSEQGFKVEAVYGDFQKSNYQQTSPRMVLVTRKK